MNSAEVTKWTALFNEILVVDGVLRAHQAIGPRYNAAIRAYESHFMAIRDWLSSTSKENDEKFTPVQAQYEDILAFMSLMHVPLSFFDVAFTQEQLSANPLLIAIYLGKMDTVRTLLRAGATVTEGLMGYAINLKNSELLNVLSTETMRMPGMINTLRLNLQAWTGQRSINIKQLILTLNPFISNASINEVFGFKWTPVEGKPANYYARTTPLSFALSANCLEMAEALLAHPGIDPWEKNIYGQTSIYCARNYQNGAPFLKLFQEFMIEKFYLELKTQPTSSVWYQRLEQEDISRMDVIDYLIKRAKKLDKTQASIDIIQTDIHLLKDDSTCILKSYLDGLYLHRKRHYFIDELTKELAARKAELGPAAATSTTKPLSYLKPAASSSSSSTISSILTQDQSLKQKDVDVTQEKRIGNRDL